MTNKQPTALRLAYIIEGNWDRQYGKQAAAELRRLHEVNAELVEALEAVKEWDISNYVLDVPLNVRRKIQAAIAKATGKQQ
jgi:hypothetical protein